MRLMLQNYIISPPLLLSKDYVKSMRHTQLERKAGGFWFQLAGEER